MTQAKILKKGFHLHSQISARSLAIFDLQLGALGPQQEQPVSEPFNTGGSSLQASRLGGFAENVHSATILLH